MTSRSGELRKDDFYVPVLEELDKLGGSASIEALDSAIIESFGFSDEELATVYPTSGTLIIPDKIKWARSRLREARLVDSAGRGVWILTDAGREAITDGGERVQPLVKSAMREYNKRYHAKRRADSSESAEIPNQPALSDVDGDEREAERDWSDVLLTTVQGIEPAAFERLCRRMLLASGFTRVEVTGKSGDGGIDGHGVLRMNLISFQVLFQCKRYTGSVAAGTVRDFRGAMQGRADKGLIITTGTFTPDARKEATRDGAPAIDLIDGEALTDLLKSLQLGIRVEQIVSERVSVDIAFFQAV